MCRHIPPWIAIYVLAVGGCSQSHPISDDGGGCPPPATDTELCLDRGAECGTIDVGEVGVDGCGGVVACGDCVEPKVCGAVTPNHCDDCVPKTCNDLLPACGSVSNTCSGATMHCPCPCTVAEDCGSKLCIDNWCWEWRALSAMPTARAQLALAISGGKIYAIGGSNAASGAGGGALATVEAYSPDSDSWLQVAPMPTARAAVAATTTADGRIFVIGGFQDHPLATVEVYTPATDSWERVADLGTARAGLSAVAGPNDTVYAVGGSTAPDGMLGNEVSTVEYYSLLGDYWSTAAPLMRARRDLAAAYSANNLIYTIGGIELLGSTSAIHDAVETFDQNVGQWGAAPPLHTARWGLGACAAAGRVFAVGGYDPDQHFVEVEWLDFLQDDWVTTSSMPSPRWWLGVACNDLGLYAVGGFKLGGPTADVEFLGP